MPEEEIIPRVERITFSGKMMGSFDQAKAKLSDMPFFSVKASSDQLSIARVESRNIHKKPFLFYIITFTEEELNVVYSIAPDTSEKLRRLYVIKNLASILSLISGYYQIDYIKFFQYVDSSIDDALNGLSQNYSTIFNKYDSLLTEYRELKRLNLELASANRNLTIQTAQLDEENKQLKNQLKTLQTYSDEALMAMVGDWIETHSSSIDVDEFAQTYKLSVPRIEQILDKMVSQGYIDLKS